MTTRGTILRYGDLVLTNCLTRKFDQEAVLDESGVDLLYHKFTITVVGFVHGNSLVVASTAGGDPKSIGPGVVRSDTKDVPISGSGAALNETFIRGYLLHPRRAFVMAMNVPLDSLNLGEPGAEILLFCDGNDGNQGEVGDNGLLGNFSAYGIDVNNGPRPISLNVTQVSANNVFKVEYTIEVCKLECDTEGSNSNGHGVLSNRWSVEEDVDENFFTTRTISGRVRVARSNVNPFDFKGIVVPGLPGGFKRQSMKFHASPDGLSMEYTIVDREMSLSPPFPATRWTLRHTESVTNSMIAHADISVRLSAPPHASKAALVTRAAQIIWAKIFGFGFQPGINVKDQYMLETLAITAISSDSENTVEAYCRAMHAPTEADKTNNDPVLVFLVGTRFPRLAQPVDADSVSAINQANLALPPYDPAKATDPYKDLGEDFAARWLVDSLTVHLQSACSTALASHAYAQGNYPNAPWEVYDPDSEVTEVQISQAPWELPPPPEDRSESFSEAIYTEYRADDRYTTNMMKVQMPVAKSNLPSWAQSASNTENQKPTSVTIALSSPILSRVIRIRASRVGRWPKLPQPNDILVQAPSGASQNAPSPVQQSLLNHKFYPQAPERNSSGQWVYSVDAEYEYALSRNLGPSEKYELSFLPWMKYSVQQGSEPADMGKLYYDPQATNLFGPNQ